MKRDLEDDTSQTTAFYNEHAERKDGMLKSNNVNVLDSAIDVTTEIPQYLTTNYEDGIIWSFLRQAGSYEKRFVKPKVN